MKKKTAHSSPFSRVLQSSRGRDKRVFGSQLCAYGKGVVERAQQLQNTGREGKSTNQLHEPADDGWPNASSEQYIEWGLHCCDY